MYEQINDILLKEDKPSSHLEAISNSPEFKKQPFSMLLDLKSSEQSPKYHPEGNVWNHTLMVVDEAAKRKGQSKEPTVFMWSALLHDIGKPSTTKIRKGRITSYNHEHVGEKMAREFLSEFTTDGEFIDKVAYLVKYHMQILFVVNNMRFQDIKGMKENTDFREVALLGLCDRLGRTGTNRSEEEKQIRKFIQICSNYNA